MKSIKYVFIFLILFILYPSSVLAFGDSYNISEVYVEMNLGYDTYYAEISGTGIFGELKSLYKKAHISDIGFGKYVVQIKWISDDFYKIVGTSYVLKFRYASHYDFTGYEDWILDTASGLSGTVTKKDRY